MVGCALAGVLIGRAIRGLQDALFDWYCKRKQREAKPPC